MFSNVVPELCLLGEDFQPIHRYDVSVALPTHKAWRAPAVSGLSKVAPNPK